MPQASSWSRWSKVLLRTIVVLAILAGLGWGGKLVWKQISPGLFGTKREEKIPTAKVKPASIAEEIVSVGRIRAVFSTELRSEVNGRITKIMAPDGQTLVRNQDILQLDQQDLLTQLQESDRSIEAAKLRTERAQREYNRQHDLQARGLIPSKDFEEARIALALAVNDAGISESRNANLRDKLTKTVIRAPHDGTLLLKDLTEGQVITGVGGQSGGTLLGEVADLSSLMVRTNVNEIDIARLKVGDRARVRIDPLRGAIMAGTVRRIATTATESPNDRTRLFPIDVVLDTPDARLRPGMSANIAFTLARVENVPSLPLTAVFSNADSVRYVFIRKGEDFEVRAVEIGIADTRRIQILSGLVDGEEVSLTRPLKFEGEVPAQGTGPAGGP
ncbi:MAG: efflux RND transporter periplasmic adaptor subunit, partial [Opitutaceae bacterium]